MKKTKEQQEQEARQAIIIAMTRKAINGDTRAARIVLGDEKRISLEAGNLDALNKAFESLGKGE